MPGTLARNSLFGDTPYTQITVDLTPPKKLSLEVQEEHIKEIADTLREDVPPTGTGHTRLRADAIDDILYVMHY